MEMKEKHMIRNSVRVLTALLVLCLCAGVSFAQAGTDQSSDTKGTSASSKKGSKKSSSTSDSSSKKSTRKVDINSASKEDLAALPVIGDATAQKIIDGRPYKTKKDLVTKNILTQDQYNQIKDQLVAHGGKAAAGEKSDTSGKKSKKGSTDTTTPPK
jgi:competence protein ComEA